MVAVPTAFLRRHVAWLSTQLNAVTSKLSEIETALSAPPTRSHEPNLQALNHALHTLSTRLHVLHRRANFESQTLSTIQSLYFASRYGSHTPYAPLSPLRNTIESRTFDLTALPARISAARETINTLIHQRNQTLHLEVAESSQRIAEATLSDAASMRVIAVLTMCFLPGTAVAGIFGMGMFQDLGWKWIWVYFVVTVPLTIGVLGVWWVWLRRMRKRGNVLDMISGRGDLEFRDAETGEPHAVEQRQARDHETVEMHVFDTTPEKGNA
nr:hypothetical protein B0A51_11835 [Rachicladosporium sp. CCFEE 5018]